jgi:hypothetical protein
VAAKKVTKKTAVKKSEEKPVKKAAAKAVSMKSDKAVIKSKEKTAAKKTEKPAVKTEAKKLSPVKDEKTAVKKPAAKKSAVKKQDKEVNTEKKTIKVKKAKAEVLSGKTVLEDEESEVEAAKFYAPQAKSVELKKYEASIAKGSMHEGELPERYYDNKLVLMARDPYWCYAYWDISPEVMAQNTRAVKDEWGRHWLVLRVYDVTGVSFDGTNSNKYIDISVTGDANNWYLNVWEAGKTYLVELGFKTTDGHFISIARSNQVGTPLDSVSTIIEEEWMSVDEDFDEIFKLSGGGKSTIGASERAGLNLNETLSSQGGSEIYGSNQGVPGEKKRKFFLVADTELILYGATERDAKLTIKGELVKLESDGSFSARYHLPDGVMVLPVDATSYDGVDNIKITFTVERSKK